MIIKANRHLNLHTKTFTRADNHGLVHVPANQAVRVPDDVTDHPLWKTLVKSGTVVILKNKPRVEAAKALGEEEAKVMVDPQVKPDPDAEPPAVSDKPESLIPAADPLEDDEDEEEEEEEEEEKPKPEPKAKAAANK